MSKMKRPRGTGSLEKGPSGKYIARFIQADGRTRKLSTGTSDRRDAEAVLAGWLQREARIKNGQEAPGAARATAELARPLRTHLDEYLAAFERQQTRTRSSMIIRRSILGTFVRLAKGLLRREPSLRDLDANLIERVMCRRLAEGKAARTANTQRQYILAFAAWATDDGRGDFSKLGRKVKRRREALDRRRQRRALTEAEETALLACAGTRRLAYRMALETGLRRSELKGLTWADLDLERGIGHVRNTKASCANDFNILPGLMADLRAARRLFVPGAAPRVFTTLPTHRTVRRDLERAGIEVRNEGGKVIDFHALRGTLGTRLALAGIAPQVAQRVMRHSDYRTTVQHYQHLTLHDQRQALEKALASKQVQLAEGTSGGAIAVPRDSTSRGTSQRAKAVISGLLSATDAKAAAMATTAQTLSLREFVRVLAQRCESLLDSQTRRTIGAVG